MCISEGFRSLSAVRRVDARLSGYCFCSGMFDTRGAHLLAVEIDGCMILTAATIRVLLYNAEMLKDDKYVAWASSTCFGGTFVAEVLKHKPPC